MFLFFADVAHAMGAAPGGGQAADPQSQLMQFAPLLIMFAIFYFLLIRPQQKKQKELRKVLDELKRGDYVVLHAGIYARIIQARPESLVVEIAPGTEIVIGRQAVAGRVDSIPNGDSQDKGKPKGKEKNAPKEPEVIEPEKPSDA